MREIKKTFNLKMFTDPEVQLFTKFQRIAIYHQETPREVLLEMVRTYVQSHRVKPRLAFEGEVIAAAHKKGLKTNKALLIKYRTDGNLDGMWRANDDGRIVYELDPVLKFLQNRQGPGGTWREKRNGKDHGKKPTA